MKIHELHTPSKRFLRSTHLERDFYDPTSLEDYVLTPEIEATVSRVSHGLNPTSGQRAWRITGDYGCGKSSFALLLANVVSREGSSLPKHVRHLQREHGLAGEKQKLLPVLVTGSRDPIALVLLRALLRTLDQHVDGRIALRSRAVIKEALREPQKIDDAKAVEWVKAVAKELFEKDLSRGVFIVLDELGKFLEFAALHPERQDVFFLQQLGEASADRDSCLFTVGLLHQGFGAYADKLSEAAQREWEKVAARFEEIVFGQPLTQVATLIAASLQVKDDPVLRGWKTKAQGSMTRAVELGMFGAGAPKTTLSQIAPELYPLHPTVLPVLTKFFRRFGQNERSLFSFLLSSEPYALKSFTVREASLDSVYRLADFFDFAATNFGHRLSTQSFRSHWNHIDGLIRSFPIELTAELKILKTIGLLNTIESPELIPTADVIALALDDSGELEGILKRLVSRGVLFYRGRSGGYALWPHGSVNLEQAFIRASEAVTTIRNIPEAIRHRLEARPIVASRHYIATGNLRYFELIYTSCASLRENAELLRPRHPYDGRLVVVLCETRGQQLEGAEFARAAANNPAALLGVTSPLETLGGLLLELERWSWVEQQTPELKDDRYAAEEVSRQVSVATGTLERAIARHVGIRGVLEQGPSTIQWFYNGDLHATEKVARNIQAAVSDICDRLFVHAPRVQNELVNRHELSSAAAAARQKLFGLMIGRRHEPDLGFVEGKAPPEKSMFLSVLRSTGIHRKHDGIWDIRVPTAAVDKKGHVAPALAHIVSILERKPDARVNVLTIMGELRQPPYGVRDGIISVFLLAVLIEHETEIAVYEEGKFVPEIEEFLMMRLAKRPETFELQLTRIAGVRRRLIEKFAEVLATHKSDRLELVAIVRPLCAAVGALPEYVHLTERVSGPTRALRAEVLRSQEPADLIFNSIPRALGFKETDSALDASAVAQALATSLTELRRAFPDLQTRLSQSILKAFGANEKMLAEWRHGIARRAGNVAVAVTAPELRAFVLKLCDDATDEGDWLEALGSMLVRRPPSRWRDQDEAVFGERLDEMTQKFFRVETTHFGVGAAQAQEAIRIAITRKNGEEADRVLSLSTQQGKEAEQARELIEGKLPKNRDVALVALSRLIWSLLKGGS